MEYWRNNTIWFDEIPDSRFLNLDLKEEKINTVALQNLEYLILWHHKKSKSGNLNDMPEDLLYLELNSSNIQSFIGIKKMERLKRLELHHCTKLENDSGLAGIAVSLEHLHINQSKKFVPTEELFLLKNLRVLCLNSCGNLNDLRFLNHFPKLIDFRFVDTNVLDGDLSPIFEHPTIRSVGYLDKKHYNIKSEKLKSLLEEKNNRQEYKSVIKKEEYQTFRYLY
jgi:hypothetical protein